MYKYFYFKKGIIFIYNALKLATINQFQQMRLLFAPQIWQIMIFWPIVQATNCGL